MRNVTVAAVQMKCSKSVEKNIAHAEELVRQAAEKGAEIVLLPELFERPYFCQERRYEYYEYAQTAEENPAVRHFSRVAAELGIVIPVSFYEKEVNNTYNSVAVLDADGKNLGVYRKTHIPDDHYYQEKFYFTPGDTGFKVFDTRFGTIGVGICWDKATELYQFFFIDVEKLPTLFFIPYNHIANTKRPSNKCVWSLFFQPLPGCHRRIAGGRLSFICTLVILMMNQKAVLYLLCIGFCPMLMMHLFDLENSILVYHFTFSPFPAPPAYAIPVPAP